MDMKIWRTTSHHHQRHYPIPAGRSFSERRNYDIFVTPESVKARSKVQGFMKSLRRKLWKEKNKVFNCTEFRNPYDPYDPYTYSQNFEDPESRRAEPDNLTRTFSAQFAATSLRISKKSKVNSMASLMGH